MTIFRKTLLAAAILAPLAPAVSYAATITAGGDVVSDVAAFDWGPSSTIAVNGNQAFVDFVNTGGTCTGTTTGCKNDVYSHAQLSAYNDSNNDPISGTSLGSAYEITYELGFSEKVIGGFSITGLNSVIFGFGPDGKTTGFTSADAVMSDGTTSNFFRMYVDTSPDANSLEGTGFGAGADATLVLSGQILPYGDFNSNFTANTGSTSIVPIGGSGATTPNPAWYIGGSPVNTVSGTGGTTSLDMLVLVSYVDTSFFGGDLTSFLLSNINQLLPFTTTNPSLRFPEGAVADAKTAVAGAGAHINGGTTLSNGLLVATNPSVMFQSDSNSPFAVIPEPNVLALLSLGLLGIGAARRRHA